MIKKRTVFVAKGSSIHKVQFLKYFTISECLPIRIANPKPSNTQVNIFNITFRSAVTVKTDFVPKDDCENDWLKGYH